ncbi:MAG: hypothetical protein CBD59_01115 [Alphaproteobacteria bacterium TMED199]|nr:MAG: hypothetical protein CBD59_01115 [Alphaproteobacteria bacterium TMED199]
MEILLFIFPLLSYLLFQFFSQKIKTGNLYAFNYLLCTLNFSLSIYIFIKILNLNTDLPLFFFKILKVENLLIDWYLRFDLFVSSLIVLITFIGLLLTVYLTNLSKNHSTNFKINSYLSLSIFSVLVLITSNNLFQFFLGWYLVIISFYLIYNIFKNRIDNSNNFFENRVSDLCFFLSLYFIYTFSKSINFDVIFKSYKTIENNTTILNYTFNNFEIIIFILFFSFLLRFRQFYISNSSYDLLSLNTSSYSLLLYVLYIPIGLYFILRFLSLTHLSLHYSNIILLLGLIFTLIFSILLFQSYKLNRLILYIASSQFCVLLIGIGLKLYNAVLFHFFISIITLLILSLSFGIISSKLNNEQDIRKMGNLIIKCPFTFLFILISFVSLLGIPYFSGFYSHQLFLSQLSLITKESYFFIITYCFYYTFVMSYISFKIILIVFLGENNCNIHLFNKIKEGSYYLKFILFILSFFIIFLGWYLNNLFTGNFGENLWRLVLIEDISFSINNNFDKNEELLKTRNIVCYIGIVLAFLNYFIFPKLGNNLRLKNNKLFRYYLKSFTSYDFNR